MTRDEIKALAKQAGGTPYVNRHYPGETVVAFGPVALVEFVRLVQGAFDFDVRGMCAENLLCWHRLTGQESEQLVAFVKTIKEQP